MLIGHNSADMMFIYFRPNPAMSSLADNHVSCSARARDPEAFHVTHRLFARDQRKCSKARTTVKYGAPRIHQSMTVCFHARNVLMVS